MAKVIKNPKGFKVISASLVEMNQHFSAVPVCDRCNGATLNGFLIAVLNQWFCPTCYVNWSEWAEYYAEDAEIERRNYNRHKAMLNIK